MAKHFSILLAALLGLVAASTLAAGFGRGGARETSPLEPLAARLTLSADRVSPGGTLRATLQVSATGPRAATLSFSSAQRFDLWLEDSSGRELWRWSDGRMFAQVVGSETLEPGGRTLLYRVDVPAPEEAGRYRLVGELTILGPAPPRAEATFTVP